MTFTEDEVRAALEAVIRYERARAARQLRLLLAGIDQAVRETEGFR